MCRVLVVDDHADTREALGALVESEGHVLGQACNGQEALEWLAAQIELPCIILLDLQMPVMDGWDFFHVVRRVPKWAQIGIVVVSANLGADPTRPIFPAQGFLSKPLGLEEIGNLYRYCDQHRDSWTPSAASRG